MKRASALVFAAFLVSFCPTDVLACSCADPSAREKFRHADAVFLGKVVELTPFGPTEDFPLAMYVVRFEVERRWKGARGREVEAVADFDQPGFCGDLNLTVGEKYLIYAPRQKGRLRVHTDCGPNRHARDAVEELKLLGSFRFRALARLYPYPKF
jgi:hypothetical protein